MKEENQLQILFEENKFMKVDSFISEFCKKYRVYDEYYGVVSRAVDIVLTKIKAQNPKYSDYLEIRYKYDGNSLRFEIRGNTTLNVMFDSDAEEKELETLKLLVSEVEFIDTNVMGITFMLNAIHQQEWVRRNNLIQNYYYKTRKHV